MRNPEPLWKKEGSSLQKDPVAIDPKKRRNQSIGIIWILSPIISLPIVLSVYAIVRFTATQLATESISRGDTLHPVSSGVIFFQISNFILSAIPLLLIPLGLIIGLYYLFKKK